MPRANVLALCIFLQLALSAASIAGPTVVDKAKTTAIGPNPSTNSLAASSGPLLGVYDPHDVLSDSDRPRIEHVYVYWQAVDEPMLAAKMRLAEMKKRTLMVTVEPYTRAVNWRDGG